MGDLLPDAGPQISLLRVLRELGVRLGSLCGAALLIPGPVEPGQQRFDIGRLDRRASPDTPARRRRAMTGDTVCRTFLLKPPGHRAPPLKASLGGSAGDP